MIRDYDCYLFDADGTILDTTELIYRCFEHTGRVFGHDPVERETIVGKIGLTLREQMQIQFGPLTAEQAVRYERTHMEHQLSIYTQYLRLFAGVPEALAALKRRGSRCAVVTSRRMPTLELYLRHTGIDTCFDALVTPEMTQRHKPDPEPALAALSKLKCSPDRALFVGDATFDIECGHRAGTDTAFVAWSSNKVSQLTTTPTYILENMRELCGGHI